MALTEAAAVLRRTQETLSTAKVRRRSVWRAEWAPHHEARDF